MALFFVILVLFSSLDSLFGTEYDQCMDQTGQIRAEGETWMAEGCRECMCMEGSVMCVMLEVYCPPRPEGDCVEVPGPCCPDYDCNGSGPDCSAVSCPSPPRLLCDPIIPPGECCAIDWICKCRDPQGKLRDEGEVWMDPITPCVVCSCHEGVVECFNECSRSCYPYCNTGGCVDDQGVPRNEGEMWMDPTDPCTFCSCEAEMVQCYVRDCPPPPATPCVHPPNHSQCCPDCDPSLGYGK